MRTNNFRFVQLQYLYNRCTFKTPKANIISSFVSVLPFIIFVTVKPFFVKIVFNHFHCGISIFRWQFNNFLHGTVWLAFIKTTTAIRVIYSGGTQQIIQQQIIKWYCFCRNLFKYFFIDFKQNPQCCQPQCSGSISDKRIPCEYFAQISFISSLNRLAASFAKTNKLSAG